MAEDRLDVSEFLKNDLMVEHISKTRKILGVFEDELYCYLAKKEADTKAVTSFIEEINDEQEIKKIIISEIMDDEVQEAVVKFLSKKGIKFRFVSEYSEKDGAYMVIVAKEDIQRDPLKFETDVPEDYLSVYGRILCKKHYREIEKIDSYFAKGFTRESFLAKGTCAMCLLKSRKG